MSRRETARSRLSMARIDDEVPDPYSASDEWVLAEYEAMMVDPACVNAKEEFSAKFKMVPSSLKRVVARARKARRVPSAVDRWRHTRELLDESVLAEYEALLADPACVNANKEFSAKLKITPRVPLGGWSPRHARLD